MSLILDALRRAESQRQRQIQPAFSLPGAPSTRAAGPPSPLVWGIVAASSLIVAALVAVLLMRTGPGGEPVAPTPAASLPPTAPAGAARAGRLPSPAAVAPTAPAARPTGARRIASLSEEARRGLPTAARAGAAEAAVRTAPSGAATNTTYDASPPPGTVQIVPAETNANPTGLRAGRGNSDAAGPAPGTMEVRDLMAEEGMPSSGTIAVTGTRPAAPADNGSGAAGLSGAPTGAGDSNTAVSDANLDTAPAEFTLNMLTTSADPANSYVYINMRRYRIGDQTPEGAVVQDINNRGVVIAWRGERFLLTLR